MLWGRMYLGSARSKDHYCFQPHSRTESKRGTDKKYAKRSKLKGSAAGVPRRGFNPAALPQGVAWAVRDHIRRKFDSIVRITQSNVPFPAGERPRRGFSRAATGARAARAENTVKNEVF